MRISSITKNAGKACNNRLYRHIRTFEKIVKNYFVIWYTSHMFSAITLRLGKAFQFDNVKSSVLAFQLGESSNNKILVSKQEQKNFIIAPEHNCVVDEAGFEKYIIVE